MSNIPTSTENPTYFETFMFDFVQETIWSSNWKECNPEELRDIICDIHNGLSFLNNHKDVVLDVGELEEYIFSYKERNSEIEHEIEQLKGLENSSKLIDFNKVKDGYSTIEDLQSDMELTNFFIHLLEKCRTYHRLFDESFEGTSLNSH